MWTYRPPACKMKGCGNGIQATQLKKLHDSIIPVTGSLEGESQVARYPRVKDRGIRMGTTAFSAQESRTF